MTVIQYAKRDLSPHDVLEALELITEICNFLWNKKRMKRESLSLETLYYIIRVWQYGNTCNYLMKEV